MVLRTLCHAAGCLALVVALLQISLSIAIAVVVRQALWTYVGGWHWSASWWSHTSAQNVCLMTNGSANLCAFTYVVVAVSLVASLLVVIGQLFSQRRACCACLEGWLAVLLAALWIAAATTATVYGVRADNNSPPVPRQPARTAVWAMAWAEAGLWMLSALLACLARTAARRTYSETELSASLTSGSKRYHRYNVEDTPFAARSSKWREARDAYIARGAEAAAARRLPVV